MVRRSHGRKRYGGSNHNPMVDDGKAHHRPGTVSPAPAVVDQVMSGGRRRSHRRHHSKRHDGMCRQCHHKPQHRHHECSDCHHKRRGGSMLGTALLPFGLFGLQKYFQKSRVNPLKKLGRSAKRTVKRIF